MYLYNEICIIVLTKPYTINSNISYVYFTVYNYDIVNIYYYCKFMYHR